MSIEGARAGPIAVGGNSQSQGIVWAIIVIAMAPGVECLLSLVEIVEGADIEQLSLKRAVEALVLAMALRMDAADCAKAPRRAR